MKKRPQMHYPALSRFCVAINTICFHSGRNVLSFLRKILPEKSVLPGDWGQKQVLRSPVPRVHSPGGGGSALSCLPGSLPSPPAAALVAMALLDSPHFWLD